MGKCMIGPAVPKHVCPECDGQGGREKTRMDYKPGWGVLPSECGEWEEITVFVLCDICGGSGRVTKKTAETLTA